MLTEINKFSVEFKTNYRDSVYGYGMGKLFNLCGPAYLKHLSPYDLNRDLHSLIKHLSLDLRDRMLTYGTIKSHR